MKIICFLILTSFFSHAQVSWQIKTNENVKWYYQFGDEFNTSNLDFSKWRSGLPWGNVMMNQDLVFSENNLVFENGVIKFLTNKEIIKTKLQPWQIDSSYLKKNKTALENQLYTSHFSAGLITSNQKFKYGYFEIRFKSTGQKGTWPAFWLYGGEPNEEIDFFELKGELSNKIHVDVHCPNGCDNYKSGIFNFKKNWGSWISSKNKLEDGWNIVSGEWQPGYIKWFLNGNPIAYFKGDFKSEQLLIINNSLAQNNGPFNPGPDETTKWPSSFDVDYVRVWSKEDTILKYQNNYKEFLNSDKNILNGVLYQTELKKKDRFVYNTKQLDSEIGFISILPILYNKIGLYIQGKKLGKIQVDVLDKDGKKVAGFGLENVSYYILDLSALPTGSYKILISVLNQTLTHDIPVINPDKIGEQ